MKKKKRRVGLAFLSIFAIVLCAGVAYELVNLKLDRVMSNATAKDKWCVKIEGVSEPLISEGASSSDLVIKKTNISFKGNLDTKDDSISYQFKVINCGTVDAYYFNDSINNSDNVSYKIDGIKVGDIIKPKDYKKITLSMVNSSTEKIENDYQFKLNFTQAD